MKIEWYLRGKTITSTNPYKLKGENMKCVICGLKIETDVDG